MRAKHFLLFALLGSTMAATAQTLDPELTIWFTHPASTFTESSPIGNGRLGAMIFGGIDEDHIVLNESTMWSGSPQDSDDPNAYKFLPEIRRLLMEGKNRAAQDLLQAHFICKGPGSSQGSGKDGPYGCYQVFGDLDISSPQLAFTNYKRILDLDRALVNITWESGGVHYRKEAFASAPAQVIVYRLTADRPGMITFDANLTRSERATSTPDGDQIVLQGQLNSGNPSVQGIRFQGRLGVVHRGGSISVDSTGIHIHGANEATLVFTAGTDMFDQKFAESAKTSLDHALATPYSNLKSESIKDYQRFFHRVSLTLPKGPGHEKPTEERLLTSQNQEDPSLAALYFNFGRYLLIESSRPNSPLPNNLQGIWAEELQTPWNGDFHLDVNVEMNYWPAEVCNLSDCAEPLLRFIPRLVPNGRKTAKAYYSAHGWVAHVITNPWLFTSPGEGAGWGSSSTGSGWLCEHLWNHYAFTGDRKYLADVYPVMKEAAEFYLDMLIPEPTHGWLVTSPSNSPENSYIDDRGEEVSTCMGPTFDSEIIRELFGNVAAASQVLGVDREFRARVLAAKAKLAPTRIGRFGQIMEWLEDYKETDVHHRHVSPLFGLYPSHSITVEKTPALAKAAEVTLERRGDMGTGWSLAWKICLWARLGQGDHAWTLIKRLLHSTTAKGYDMENGGGTYPNLFDAHPPFQIDGNFGGTAGIAEMLLQSRKGEIRLLPALPKAWASQGAVSGLKAIGGITVDIKWKDGSPTDVHLKGPGADKVKVDYRALLKTPLLIVSTPSRS